MITTLVLAVSAVAMQPDFSWQGNLRAGQRLAVSNIVGDIRVEPATGGRAEVTAVKRAGRRGDPEAVDIRAEETANGVRICVRYPSDRLPDPIRTSWRCGDRQSGSNRDHPNDTQVEFTVRLPAGVHLDAKTVSGDVNARELTAEAEVMTVSGRVLVDGFSGEELSAKTVSGDVELRNIRARQARGETVSGDVTYQGPLDRQGSYDFKTLSGRVLVTLPEGTGAELRASTFSGRIRFPETALSAVNIRRNNRASARIGDGGANLWVESFSGNVEIRYGR